MYASAAELAHALRAQQVADGTMSFVFKSTLSDAPQQSINGSGAVRANSAETDFQQSIDGNGSAGDVGTSVIVIGLNAFAKSGSLQDPSPWSVQKYAASAKGANLLGVFTANMLWFTQLDGSSDAFTLTGASKVLGSEDTEYRLTGEDVTASNLAFRHAGLPDAFSNQAIPSPLGLNLKLDNGGRLKAAHWQDTAEGKTLNIDYTFSRWGAPVDISAPVVR
jgi:hypothetical protein